MDVLKDTLINLFTTETEKVKREKIKLQDEYNKFMYYKSEEDGKLKKAKEEVLKENLTLGTGNVEEEEMKIPSEIIELDIGGTQKIATARATLTKFPSSALGCMFSGKHKLKKHHGRIFIDRDGGPFVSVITYLRTGKIPVFNSKIEEAKFLEEMEFWQIPLETLHGSDIYCEQEFDPEW
mmetsp:Transcript_16308/g.16027  ORF Transcript_16308/g.16027 Transcript_16308/m.16027 type:complete len:180 (+) Transcript_16308:300-839(+)